MKPGIVSVREPIAQSAKKHSKKNDERSCWDEYFRQKTYEPYALGNKSESIIVSQKNTSSDPIVDSSLSSNPDKDLDVLPLSYKFEKGGPNYTKNKNMDSLIVKAKPCKTNNSVYCFSKLEVIVLAILLLALIAGISYLEGMNKVLTQINGGIL